MVKDDVRNYSIVKQLFIACKMWVNMNPVTVQALDHAIKVEQSLV